MSGFRKPSEIYRIYGREFVKGIVLVCILDESTCLQCLELDSSRDPPPLPIHKGCRCELEPLFEIELGRPGGMHRASAIGGVPASGGIYKAYLIERARAVETGLEGESLANHLRNWLADIERHESADASIIAGVKSSILKFAPSVKAEEVQSILHNIEWRSPNLQMVFDHCVALGMLNSLDEGLQRMASQVINYGEYTGRHKGMLYRLAADAVKRTDLEKALLYMEQAAGFDPNNTAILVQLGSLYRRIGQIDRAIAILEQVVRMNPSHKGAAKELERLARSASKADDLPA
jgi:tetratricopeptide (TPR) repeat protein